MNPTSDASRVRAAYDGVAADYDRYLDRDLWMRRVLWRHFSRLFRPGDAVLDAGCGTGSDTIHLAARGVRVTAVDVSSRMLSELQGKLATASFASLVDVRIGDLNAVADSFPHPFDGIISSFGPLNTVDLDRFGETAARLLRPGGRLVCHMLSPGHLASGLLGRLGAAAFPKNGEATLDIGGESVPHLVLKPAEVYSRFFSRCFVLRRSYALGFLVHRRLETLLPARLLDALGSIECVVGALPPLGSMGRFFVLDLERSR